MSHSLTAPRRNSNSDVTWTALSNAETPPHAQPLSSSTGATNNIHTYQSPVHSGPDHIDAPRSQSPRHHATEQETLLDVVTTNDTRTDSYIPNTQRHIDATHTYQHNDAINTHQDSDETRTQQDSRSDHVRPDHHDASSFKHPMGDWRPYTLRPAFLGFMVLVALALSITLAVLAWYSVKNSGLGKDADTAGFLVARRYLPTILAVFFTQTMVIVSNDIKRTEPFARLARSDQLDVKHSLLYTSKAWWSTIREGSVRRRNSGRIGWVLVISSLATGISILSLSTLSSSLLVSEQVVLHSDVNLQKFSPSLIDLKPRRQAYLRTTSGFSFNASTSMWVSDEHVVLPFGPMDLDKYPDFLPEGKWETETKVLQMESTCKRMKFSGFETANRSGIQEYYKPPGPYYGFSSASYNSQKKNFKNTTTLRPHLGFALDSEDDCHIQVLAAIGSRSDHRIILNGGLVWTNLSSSYVSYNQWAKERGSPLFMRESEWSPADTGLMFEFSESCIGRNLLMITTPWTDDPKAKKLDNEGFEVRAELCTSEYFEVKANVIATVTNDTRRLDLDEDALRSHRSPVSKDLLNIDTIQELTFGRDKLEYLYRATTLMGNSAYEGLSETLSAVYSFNNTVMLENSTLTQEAARLNKRFFGELVLSAMTNQQPQALKTSVGQHTRIEQRIVVVTEAAAVLSALLFLISCYLLYLCWIEASRRRPLNLSSDPATTFGSGAYLQHNPYISALLATAKSRIARSHKVQETKSARYAGNRKDKTPEVTVREQKSIEEAKKIASTTWKPTVIRSWSLFALIIAFVLIAVAILVLHSFASRQMLYRSAFVYQLDLRVFNARFSPQSVLASLLAVGVAMWWDIVDKVFRSMQPFLSMSQSKVNVRNGAALSYQSSYWLWATARAVMNSHWLLSLVTFGTTLCQVLIVAMAAIFERGPGITTTIAHANNAYVPRQTSITYNHTTNPFIGLQETLIDHAPFLQNAMRITSSDWLYSALDQITLDSQQPAWSRDGWSFTPVNMASLPLIQSFGASDAQDDTGASVDSLANSTLTTSALRARLECDKVETEDPTWFATNEVDLFFGENSTEAIETKDRLNRTGYILPHTVFDNTEHETSVFSRTSTIQCCSNETDPTGRAAVGYWSQMNTTAWWARDAILGLSGWVGYGPETWPPNFAVKWIVGPTTTSNVTAYTNGAASKYRIMQFTEIPPMAFLDCKPVIEKADAKVTLSHGTGQVLDFEILGDPQAQMEPWSAHFRHLNESDTKSQIATVSYGSYFLTQLLGASSIAPLDHAIGYFPPFDFENLDDDRFNIRDKEKGYNMDFMSYANLYQANMDPMALLDTDILMKHSQRTFQTFFQHFASQTKWLDGQMMAYENTTGENTQKVEVTITQRMETLNMVPSATWLSLAIIFILISILGILIVSLKIYYPHDILQNNIKCLADVLTLIEGSERLLWLAERHDIKTLRESGLSTRLGWFKDREGNVRWGIELLDAPGIEWIEEPKASKMGRVMEDGA